MGHSTLTSMPNVCCINGLIDIAMSYEEPDATISKRLGAMPQNCSTRGPTSASRCAMISRAIAGACSI